MITTFILKCAVLVAAQNQIFSGGLPSYAMQFQSNGQKFNQTQFIPRINENMCIRMMDGMVFPDPDNCDVFVTCQNGMVIRQRCPIGTLFDLNLYYCVVAHATNCGSRVQQNIPVQPPVQRPVPPTSEAHHSVR